MNFKEWMLHRGLSQSTAEKYAGALSGPLSEWAIGAGLVQGPLVAMESPTSYASISSRLIELPIFVERNARGHHMYSSALTKFGDYLADGYNNDLEADLESVLEDQFTSSTEKMELIKARIGQGTFRQQLLRHWQGCAVTGYNELRMLIASHIKPWRAASNSERIDPFNGLLLTPNLDRAFDRGYVTFDQHGKLLVSPLLPDRNLLGISEHMSASLQPEHQPFMAYHREKVFRSQ